MLIAALLTNLANRAGITAQDAKLIDALQAMPADLDVPDALANAVVAGLMNETEAKNNATLKKHFAGQALNTLDGLYDPELDDLLADDPDLPTLKSDKSSTFKKAQKLLAKTKELKAKLAAAETPKEVKQYTDQINKLTRDLSDAATKYEAEKATALAEQKRGFQKDLFEKDFTAKLLARTDLNDFARAKNGRRVLTDYLEYLDEKGIVIDYETGKLVQKADPKLDATIDGQLVTSEALLEKVLEGDYLKKGDTAPITPTTINPTAQAPKGQSKASQMMPGAAGLENGGLAPA